MDQRRNHTFYISNETSLMIDELSGEWGIKRNAVLERMTHAVYEARSALTYKIAQQQAEQMAAGEEPDIPPRA